MIIGPVAYGYVVVSDFWQRATGYDNSAVDVLLASNYKFTVFDTREAAEEAITEAQRATPIAISGTLRVIEVAFTEITS